MRNHLPALLALIAAVASTVACGPRPANLSYEKDVRPILMERCSACHARGRPGFAASGLDTTSHAGLMAGSRRGTLVSPGDAFASMRQLLLTARAHGRRHVSLDEYAVLWVWVCEGAKDN